MRPFRSRVALAIALAAFSLGVTIIACSSSSGGSANPKTDAGADSATSSDSGTSTDAPEFTAATLHAIDLGDLSSTVDVRGAYVLTPVIVVESLSTGACEYWAIVEDTRACPAPPCGLIVSASQSAGGASCPSPANTTTVMAKIHQGETIDVTGTVAVAIQSVDAASPLVAHFIDVSTITESQTAAPAPSKVTIADPSIFIAQSGSGWSAYEGTYVNVAPDAPDAASLTILSVDANGNFTATPGDASFGTRFMSIADAGAPPDAGSVWSSIAGVPFPIQGGFVETISASDFAP